MTHTLDTLQKLYDSEINFDLFCFWDAGFAARLGDEHNGYVWEEDQFETIALAVEALVKAAVEYYPDSEFAKNYGGSNG